MNIIQCAKCKRYIFEGEQVFLFKSNENQPVVYCSDCTEKHNEKTNAIAVYDEKKEMKKRKFINLQGTRINVNEIITYNTYDYDSCHMIYISLKNKNSIGLKYSIGDDVLRDRDLRTLDVLLLENN